MTKLNKNVSGKGADFTNETETKKMFQDAVKIYKKIDILIVIPVRMVSNRRLKDINFSDWKGDFSKNMDSIFLLNQLAVNHMRQKSIHGKIINCSNFKSKVNNTSLVSGSEILTKNMIENYMGTVE